MKFTDINWEDFDEGSEYGYRTNLVYQRHNGSHVTIEIVAYEDEGYIDINVLTIPPREAFGSKQPEVNFRNIEAHWQDLYDAENNTNDNLINILENIRKSVSYLCTGDFDKMEWDLKG